MATSALADCRHFADDITNAGGTIPAPLVGLLSASELLMRPGAAQDPIRPILDSALAGQLDEKRLDKMLVDAAQQQQIANYRQELRARAERVLVQRFHEALADGAADEVLDSLRPIWDEHAQAIERTRSLVPAETDLTQWLAGAKPEAVTAWQALDSHLAVINRIGWIASQFGPQLGHFPQMQLFAGGDNFRLDDRAVLATGGNLENDSKLFRDPGTHRASPWCRTKLELHTVDSAKERYRQWCESEWSKTHYDRTVQFQKPDGSVGELKLENPFTAKALT
jgi:hypothetical protein